MYKGIVTVLKNVRIHPNADRVLLATCHGNQVVVGLEDKEDTLGVYFPCDGQLSEEFCRANNLFRDSLKNKDKDAKPGMFDDNRRVRAQKFRGEISDGFWVSLDYFKFIGIEGLGIEHLEIDEWKGVPICNKYVNLKTANAANQNQGKKTRTAKKSVMFKEHLDTAYLDRNMHQIKDTDLIIVTEKVHGTSHRVGHVLVDRKIKWYEKPLRFLKVNLNETEWTYLNGTRRVVLEERKITDQSFHDPSIRVKAFDLFKDNLRKGETVFLEIVGYEPSGGSIMPMVDATKLDDKKDKAFSGRYANTGDKVHMAFSYGCHVGNCDFYVYRITMNNVEGKSIDYCWDDVVRRCGELGVKCVPEIERFLVSDYRKLHNLTDDRDFQEHMFGKLTEWCDGESLIDKTHIREGCCVRLESGLTPRIYKHKSFEFKVLEGLVKDSGAVDMEESN